MRSVDQLIDSITLQEAAEHLRVTENQLIDEVRRGRLPAFQCEDGQWCVPVYEFRRFMLGSYGDKLSELELERHLGPLPDRPLVPAVKQPIPRLPSERATWEYYEPNEDLEDLEDDLCTAMPLGDCLVGQ